MRHSILELQGQYKGFDYFVVFGDLGVRLGYVRIPDDHPGSKWMTTDDCEHLNVHGGITYIGQLGGFEWWKQAKWGRFDIKWGRFDMGIDVCIGFDCLHCFDGIDIETAEKLFPESKINSSFRDAFSENKLYIRTKEFVENECKKLIDQLVEIK